MKKGCLQKRENMYPYLEPMGLPEPLPTKPQEYEAWRAKVIQHRAMIYWETDANPNHKEKQNARAREIVRVERSFIYFANTYLGIFEAREDVGDSVVGEVKEDEQTGTEHKALLIPFVMYPFQLEIANWLEERMHYVDRRGDGLGVKARDMGLSNIVCFFLDHRWLVKRRFQARVLSRNEDKVDQIDDPDSLFWKLEYALRSIPHWLLAHFAGDFRWDKHRNKMRLLNPKSRNLISGESTNASAGRGGRATIIFYDEAAFMEHFASIWTAGRDSTNHRIAVSTVSTEKGFDFYNLHQGKGIVAPPVIELPHYLHPYHGKAWEDRQKERDSAAGYQQEVLMEYFAGQSNIVYPSTHNKVPDEFPYIPYGGDVFCMIDDGIDDDWAMVFAQLVRSTGRIRFLYSYENRMQPVDFYGSLLRRRPVDTFDYGPRELDLMHFLMTIPAMSYVGDPHGSNIEQVSGTSPFEHLSARWGINVMVDYTKRSHTKRREMTREVIPMMDFDREPSSVAVLEAMQRSRMKESREGRDQIAEYRIPLHDQYSHLRTCVEYLCVNLPVLVIGGTFGNPGMKWTGESHG